MDVQLDEGAARLAPRGARAIGRPHRTSNGHYGILGEDRGSAVSSSMTARASNAKWSSSSAGIRPNAETRRDAGLTVERGIVVDDDSSCANDPDVFAIGECAQHRGQVYGLVAPLWEQAQILADRLTGRTQSAYRRFQLSTKLKVMGVDLSVDGRRGSRSPDDEVIVYPNLRAGFTRS